MADDKVKTVAYVSWIKVKGIHLLPPVITEKRRIELQRYKQQAIKLEKRLRHCRELKKNLEELLHLQPLSDRPQSEIAFKDDSHVEGLGITEKNKGTDNLSKTKLRSIKLSKDIIDVTEYNSDGIKIIYNDVDVNCAELNQGSQGLNNSNETLKMSPSQLHKITSILQLTNNKEDLIDKNQHKDLLNNEEDNISRQIKNHSTLSDITYISPEKSPRPRLIRSNSYTLENPSPILLAHLEKNKRDELKDFKQLRDLSFTKNWSSLENNYVPFENSEYSSINTVYNNDMGNCSNTKNFTLNSTSSNDSMNKDDNINVENKTPTIEVIQTDISVQQITVNTNDGINKIDNSRDENNFKQIYNISDSNSQLMNVLRSVPESYSEQVIELIQRQMLNRQDRENIVKNSGNITAQDLCTDVEGDINTHENSHCSSPKSNFSNININLENERYPNSIEENKEFSNFEEFTDSIIQGTISVSPTQSIHYSLTSSDTLRPSSNSCLCLIDLEYADPKMENEKFDMEKFRKNVTDFYVEEEIIEKIKTNRELFPQIDETTMNVIRQEWAASVIGAHVKGYLTRRLLKTERVQTLIDTIKDALMCALQLHNAENIDESDVELHRRLINQVSAACYAFHDIFFSLSVQEQMSVISADRLRKIEKAKRPSSAPSARRSRSSSSRSSSASTQKFHPQSQSLTKV